MNTLLASNFFTDIAAMDADGKFVHTDKTRTVKRLFLQSLTKLLSEYESKLKANGIPAIGEDAHKEIARSCIIAYNVLQKSAYLTMYCYRKYAHAIEDGKFSVLDVWGYAMNRVSALAEYKMPTDIFRFVIKSGKMGNGQPYSILLLYIADTPHHMEVCLFYKQSILYMHESSNSMLKRKYMLDIDKIPTPISLYLEYNKDVISDVGHYVNHLRKQDKVM